MLRKLMLFAPLVFAMAAHAQTCASQNFFHDAPTNSWIGKIKHSSGSHSEIYDFVTQCSYDRASSPNTATDGTCDTYQSTSASMLDANDTGGTTIIGWPDAYHNILFKSQQYQGHATQAGTANHDVAAGTAVQQCDVTSGCATATVTVPPFSATGGNTFETGDFLYNDGCPAKSFSTKTGTCTCKQCGCGSPLMVDVGLTGSDIYQLTSLKDGINFDLKNTGKPQHIAWTKPGSNFAVLVLPDDNGEIKNSNQLFGNFTPQPVVKKCGANGKAVCPRNGFAALAVYDDPLKGGNGNGLIDKNDAIYYKLRLLLGKPDDPNHKLLTLQEAHIESISLSYIPTEQFEDTFGNLYKYEATVTTEQVPGSRYSTKRWMFDTWLLDERIGDKPGIVRDLRKSQ